MSTAYRTKPKLDWENFVDNLPDGVRQHFRINTEHGGPTDVDELEGQICLTNGTGYLWAYHVENHVEFERFGMNYEAGLFILNAVAEKFGVEIISEHDEGYWEPHELVEEDDGDS